jgi:hypothetical protein
MAIVAFAASSRAWCRALQGKYALLWVGVGLFLFAFAIVPDVLVPIADWVGIAYEPAVFFLAAIAFLFLMVVHFSFELSRSEERTRTLAEEVALLKARMDKTDPPLDRTPTAPVDDAPEEPPLGGPYRVDRATMRPSATKGPRAVRWCARQRTKRRRGPGPAGAGRTRGGLHGGYERGCGHDFHPWRPMRLDRVRRRGRRGPDG